MQGLEASDDEALGSLVDRGRLVASLSESTRGLALDARRQRLERAANVRGRVPAELQPGRHSSKGENRRPLAGLG